MSELLRVMKPGGMGIFQVPQELAREKTYEDPNVKTPEDKAKHFGQYDHVRVYGKDYFNRLRDAGFKVEEVDYTSTFSKEKITEYCLAKGEIIPVVYK